MSEPQITVLENGLTVVTQHVAARQAALNLTVKAGARHESKHEKGASHFLEHMMLAEAGEHSVNDIAERTQAMYGAANGSTSYELIDFDRQCRPEFVEEAITLLANGAQRPLMDAERMEKERTSILREYDLRGSENLSGDDIVQKIAFPASGLEKSIDGSKAQIKRLTAKKLEGFREKHFTAPNMVLTVVGNVDHEVVCKMAETHFADLPTHEAATAKTVRPARWRGGIKFEDIENSDSLSVHMGFESCGSQDEATLTKDILLCEILAGESKNSRLFASLRNEMGVVYDVDAELNTFKDNGALVISTTTDAEQGNDVIATICEQLASLPQTLTQEELDAAKKSLIGSLERSEAFSPEDICSELAADVAINGKPSNLDERIAAIEALTLEDMHQRAQEVFLSPPSVCITADCENPLYDYMDITHMLGKERMVDESGYVMEDNPPSADRNVADAHMAAQPAKSAARGNSAQR